MPKHDRGYHSIAAVIKCNGKRGFVPSPNWFADGKGATTPFHPGNRDGMTLAERIDLPAHQVEIAKPCSLFVIGHTGGAVADFFIASLASVWPDLVARQEFL